MRAHRNRRLTTLLGAAALVAGSMLVLTPVAHASAAPFPAGTTTITGAGTLTLPVATNIAFPFTVTFVGTSDGAGHLAFPKSAISIPTLTTSFELGGPPISATIAISATTNWTGTINTTTGVMTLAGNIKVVVDFAGNSCTIGPLTGGGLHLSTETAGGQSYAPAGDVSTATVVDRTFEIPGVVVDPSGPCPAAALINAGAGLPIPPGAQEHSLAITATIPPPVPTTTTTTAGATAPSVHAPASVHAGETITVSGDGWKPGTSVTITLESTPVVLGEATVDANGAFSKVVTIPADSPAGDHSIVLDGTNSNGVAEQVSQAITVTAAGELPRTGSPAVPLSLAGVMALAVGAGVLVLERRRLARR